MFSDLKKVRKIDIKKLSRVLGATLTCGICALGIYGAVTAFNGTGANNENFDTQDNSITQSVNTENSNNLTDTKVVKENNVDKNQDNIFLSIQNSVNNFLSSAGMFFNKTNDSANLVENENNINVENSYNNKDTDSLCGAEGLLITGDQISKNDDWEESFIGGVYTYSIHPTSSGKCFEIKNYDMQSCSNCKILIKSSSKNFDVNIKLCGVNILSDCPFKIEDNNAGNVNIILADHSENNLICTSDDNAALQKNSSMEDTGTLRISGETIGSGKLNVEGKRDGAGIGSGKYSDLENVEISGGNVTATSGHNGASIGSGFGGKVCNLTISGGTVNVKKNFGDLKEDETSDGAGIGSGAYALGTSKWNDVYDLKITNGSVTAEAYYGAAIGSGRGGGLYSLEINGGIVNASLAYDDTYFKPYGAAIGTGEHGHISYKDGYDCGLKILSGDITASGYEGAAIGTGNEGNICSHTGIKISGGAIKATQLETKKDYFGISPGIGVGFGGNLDEDSFINISCGTIYATSRNNSTGCIGTTDSRDCLGTIYITGGSIITKNFNSSLEIPGNFSKDPVDLNGDKVYPIDIDNPYDYDIYIQDTKYNGINQKAIDPSDMQLHGYLSKSLTNEITVNLKTKDSEIKESYTYVFNDSCWSKKVPECPGNLQIDGGVLDEDYNFDENSKTYYVHPLNSSKDKPLTIKNKNGVDKPIDEKIIIDAPEQNNQVYIMLCGVNIKADIPLKINGSKAGDVNLILGDFSENKLTSTGNDYEHMTAALDVANINGWLNIQAQDTDLHNGKLVAKGGWGAPGIGNSYVLDEKITTHAKHIKINSGYIDAFGGYMAPGIGSATFTTFDGIIINGGCINAVGNDAPDIGAGFDSCLGHKKCDNLQLLGGCITATHAGLGGYSEFEMEHPIVIENCSLKAADVSPQPVNSKGDLVYPISIANPNSEAVYIGDSTQPYVPCNHIAADPKDTNLYTYQPDNDLHSLQVKVGERLYAFKFDTESKKWTLLYQILDLDISATSSQEEVVYGTDYSIEKDSLIILSDKAMTIKNKPDIKQTSHHIEIIKDVNANVTLAGVNIDTSSLDVPSINIEDNSNADVNIYLKANTINELKSSYGCAGIQKNSSEVEAKGKLFINSDKTDDNPGSLICNGGSDAAGIGAGKNAETSNINICSGNITVIGGDNAAGIGGGLNAKVHEININGGAIKALGGKDSAGIGCGFGCQLDNVNITDGIITAKGGEGAADIGLSRSGDSDNAFIAITGGSVKANTINPKPCNKAYGDRVYPMIISNPESKPISIDGKSYQPCNHMVLDPEDGNLYVYQPDNYYNNLQVKVGDLVTYYTRENESWRIIEECDNDFDISATDCQEKPVKGIDYAFAMNHLVILSDKAMTIKNKIDKPKSLNYIKVEDGINADITLAGVNIDVSSLDTTAAFMISDNSLSNVKITLQEGTTNILNSGADCAGLQKNGENGMLTINGDGMLYATGGSNSAGIGGGKGGSVTGVSILGGSIIATGSYYGAGIGGGYSGAGRNITVAGGAILATGGDNAAGIGGGSVGAGSNIAFSGGTVTANGGKDAVDVGSGNNCEEKTNGVYISGGSIYVDKLDTEVFDKEQGQKVYPLVISNPNFDSVYIGDSKEPYVPCNHAAVNPKEPNTNLYTYQAENEGNSLSVKVGKKKLIYRFVEGHWVLQKNSGDLDIVNGILGENYYYENGVYTIFNTNDIEGKDCNITIKNKKNVTTSSERVVIEGTHDANITLAGVNIDTSNAGGSAFEIMNKFAYNVNINLHGGTTNTFKSSDNCAGLHKSGAKDVGKLTIKSVDKNGNPTNGSLTATGGRSSAGIGGSFLESVANIEILSGIVTATGNVGGAGIGSGYGFECTAHNIMVAGGIVTAISNGEGEGIGHGKYGKAAENLVICGGSVKASKIDSPSPIYDKLEDKDRSRVYLMKIANPYNDSVFIGDSKDPYTPCNHAAANPINPDTNLYTYQPDNRLHCIKVKVGNKVIVYILKKGQWTSDDSSSDTTNIILEKDQILPNTVVDKDVNANVTSVVPDVDVLTQKTSTTLKLDDNTKDKAIVDLKNNLIAALKH